MKVLLLLVISLLKSQAAVGVPGGLPAFSHDTSDPSPCTNHICDHVFPPYLIIDSDKNVLSYWDIFKHDSLFSSEGPPIHTFCPDNDAVLIPFPKDSSPDNLQDLDEVLSPKYNTTYAYRCRAKRKGNTFYSYSRPVEHTQLFVTSEVYLVPQDLNSVTVAKFGKLIQSLHSTRTEDNITVVITHISTPGVPTRIVLDKTTNITEQLMKLETFIDDKGDRRRLETQRAMLSFGLTGSEINDESKEVRIARLVDYVEILYPEMIPVTSWAMYGSKSSLPYYEPPQCRPDVSKYNGTDILSGFNRYQESFLDQKGWNQTKYLKISTYSQEYAEQNYTVFTFPHCTWGEEKNTLNLDTFSISWLEVCGHRFSINPRTNLNRGEMFTDTPFDHRIVVGPVNRNILNSTDCITKDKAVTETILYRCARLTNNRRPPSYKTIGPRGFNLDTKNHTFLFENLRKEDDWTCKEQIFLWDHEQKLESVNVKVNITQETDFDVQDDTMIQTKIRKLTDIQYLTCPNLADEGKYGRDHNCLAGENEDCFSDTDDRFNYQPIFEFQECTRFPGAVKLLGWGFKTSFLAQPLDVALLRELKAHYIIEIKSATVTGIKFTDPKNQFQAFKLVENGVIPARKFKGKFHSIYNQTYPPGLEQKEHLRLSLGEFVVTGTFTERVILDLFKATTTPRIKISDISSVDISLEVDFVPKNNVCESYTQGDNEHTFARCEAYTGKNSGRRLRSMESLRRLGVAADITIVDNKMVVRTGHEVHKRTMVKISNVDSSSPYKWTQNTVQKDQFFWEKLFSLQARNATDTFITSSTDNSTVFYTIDIVDLFPWLNSSSSNPNATGIYVIDFRYKVADEKDATRLKQFNIDTTVNNVKIHNNQYGVRIFPVDAMVIPTQTKKTILQLSSQESIKFINALQQVTKSTKSPTTTTKSPSMVLATKPPVSPYGSILTIATTKSPTPSEEEETQYGLIIGVTLATVIFLAMFIVLLLKFCSKDKNVDYTEEAETQGFLYDK